MAVPRADKPRGILKPQTGALKFQHARWLPSPDLAWLIEHHWMVEWDLTGQEPYLSETLPHPSVHAVLERGKSHVVGVMKGRFSRLLQGKDRVFATKFKPGSFFAILGAPVSSITNRTLPFRAVFDVDGRALEEDLLSMERGEDMVPAMEAFLRPRLREPPPELELIHRMTALIMEDREITRVEEVARRAGVGTRTLQRMFSQYVGVSPKWVIQRYRLHEAAERLVSGDAAECAQLAAELGYFDQAHFIRDFKAVVGKPPAEYARQP